MARNSSGTQNSAQRLAGAPFRDAFRELLTGYEYAQWTSTSSWFFAVEIHVLRRCGLTTNDLRLLMEMKFVEHAHEVTNRRTNGRKFQPAKDWVFGRRSCFVLTPLGVAKASAQPAQSERSDPVRLLPLSTAGAMHSEGATPSWDAALRLLTYDGKTVKQFKRRAINQEMVLSAFQEEDWPKRIYDPLAPRPCHDMKRRLSDTVWNLNHGQVEPLLHFRADGTGEAILWEPAQSTAACAES